MFTITENHNYNNNNNNISIQHKKNCTPYAVVYNLYPRRWAYRCPKHVDLFIIINKIVASSWYLLSFSYMMHGHTYIINVTC